MRVGFLTAFLLPACGVLAHADVLIVDPSGAGDFTELQAAVDAAIEGDTVLVRPSPLVQTVFGPLTIVGKGLTIIGEHDSVVRTGPVLIDSVTAPSTVVLVGVAARNAVTLSPALVARNSTGPIRIEHGRFIHGDYNEEGSGTAVLVEACADVVLYRTYVDSGLSAQFVGVVGGDGLVVVDSSVVAYSSTFVGGEGGHEYYICCPAKGGTGGNGAAIEGGRLFAAGCRFEGGPGGRAESDWSAQGGEGGIGLALFSGQAFALACEFVPGPGGDSSDQVGSEGREMTGPVTIVPGSARSIHAPRAAGENGTIAIRLRGEPGEIPRLVVSAETRAKWMAPEIGVRHTGQPISGGVVTPGPLPASGELSIDFPMPDLGSDQSLDLYLQASFRSGSEPSRLSDVLHVTVLDETHHVPCGGRVYVDADAAPGGDGSSWAAAYRDLREALLAVPGCPDDPTEVWIAEGTYVPDPVGGDPTLYFPLSSGTHVYGGFAGHEASLDGRDPVVHRAVLSGDLNGDDGPDFTFREDNSHNVLWGGSPSNRLRGLRLDGVWARGSTRGGLVFWGNAVLSGCTFFDCEGRSSNGGAIRWQGDDLDIVACSFLGNSAPFTSGGAVSLQGLGDSETNHVRIVDCLVAGNRASRYGGIHLQSYGEVIHSTVWANRSNSQAAGIEAPDGHVMGSIVWGNVSQNSSGAGAQVRCNALRLNYSCVQDFVPGPFGVGNHGFDPMFVDPLGADGVAGTADDDLRVALGSPCADAGDNGALPADVADLDRDGDVQEPLPLDRRGLARRRADALARDVGVGPLPIVDMGAFEGAGGPYERLPAPD